MGTRRKGASSRTSGRSNAPTFVAAFSAVQHPPFRTEWERKRVTGRELDPRDAKNIATSKPGRSRSKLTVLAYEDWDGRYRPARAGMHGSTVFLIAFFTSIGTALGTVYAIERFDVFHRQAPAVAETVVPDLRGFTEADARANAQASHISLLIGGREASAEAKPGSVVRQSIPAGQHVPREHPVTIVIADELPKLPSVTGLSLADATKRLEEKGYKVQAGAPAPNATVPAGMIATQNPSADSPLEKGKTVTLEVSAGAAEVEVPKLIGLTLNNAKATVEKAGLVVEMRWVSLAETPTFVVLNQKPKATEKVKPGSKVELTANQ